MDSGVCWLLVPIGRPSHGQEGSLYGAIISTSQQHTHRVRVHLLWSQHEVHKQEEEVASYTLNWPLRS